MDRRLVVALVFAVLPRAVQAQGSGSLTVPPDSPRWDLQGQAAAIDYQGRRCLEVDGGAAVLKDYVFRDGVVDVDVITPASRGFFGFQFRIADDGITAEEVYLRQHKTGAPDAMQYTPVLGGGRSWQLYNGPGFTAAVDIPKDSWFHLRLEVAGAQAKLFVGDRSVPALVMTDLKSGARQGQLALFTLTGATCFANVEIRTTADADWVRPRLTTPVGQWSSGNCRPRTMPSPGISNVH